MTVRDLLERSCLSPCRATRSRLWGASACLARLTELGRWRRHLGCTDCPFTCVQLSWCWPCLVKVVCRMLRLILRLGLLKLTLLTLLLLLLLLKLFKPLLKVLKPKTRSASLRRAGTEDMGLNAHTETCYIRFLVVLGPAHRAGDGIDEQLVELFVADEGQREVEGNRQITLRSAG